MSQAVTEQARPAPLVRQGRIAGLCYLMVIAGGLYAEVFVRGSLSWRATPPRQHARSPPTRHCGGRGGD